jgi:tRNA pseudouridine55 synthase
MFADGLLIVDKPVGPTSHDVVARVRRVLKQPRIGHTGTLDPLASGVLLLVVGRATRLAQFLNAGAKRYEATIRLGFSTDTFDAAGAPTTAVYAGQLPPRDRIEEVLETFRGTFTQQPPAFSAKKIEGRRSYRLARANQTVLPAPVAVTVSHLQLLEVAHDQLRLDVACSSGFYVRSLAQDLGAHLGVGAHLTALCRTAASGRTLAEAIPLAAIEQPDTGLERARQALIPLAEMLPDLPPLTLSSGGVQRAVRGCDIGAGELARAGDEASTSLAAFPARVRLLTESRRLIGIADLTPAGLLHPVVVLM